MFPERIKHFIQQSWLLIVAAFCFGVLVAVTNAALSPRIEQNKIDKMNRLMSSLLPQAQSFELTAQLQIISPKGKQITSNLYKALLSSGDCIGWSFNTKGPGFADKIELIIAVDKDFKTIEGFAILSSNETPGFGDKIKFPYYSNQFKGIPADKLRLSKTGDPQIKDAEIVAISGATVSSEAVVKIINNCLSQIKEQVQKKGLIGNAK